jgi:BirA family transcriptional regulator, biotin operon repressor / biotin---[acetyl-CoA-carboxylase] ligase
MQFGYGLSPFAAPGGSDPFDLASLSAALAGTPYGNKIHYHPTIDSTNTHAMQQAKEGAPSHSVYFAEEQTAGRGRGGHTWHSAPGSGLYVSVLLRPDVTPADALWFSLAAGIAVRNAVHQITALVADLRWPNDLLFGGNKRGTRKFSGILTELHAEGTRVRHLVIGIGINVHQDHFPDELSQLATSLRIESGQHFPRQQLLIALLKSLEEETAALANPDTAPQAKQAILTGLEAASTWIRGKQVIVNEHLAEASFTGTTAGLDERGFLLVDTPDGLRTVHSGGVREAPAK